MILFSGICVADERTVRTEVNTDVRVGAYTQLSEKTCRADGMPSVDFELLPDNGKVFTKPEPMTLTRIFTGSTRCKGRRVDGIAIFYSPSPDFVGEDKVIYRITFTNLKPLSPNRTWTHTVHVQVGSSSSQAKPR